MAAFRRLLNDVNNNRPTTLQTDKGSEFLNRPLQTVAERVTACITSRRHNEETKASVVERFNRSLKTRMWRYFTKNRRSATSTRYRIFVRSYQRQLSSQHRHGSFGGERRQSGNGVAAVVRARRWWYAKYRVGDRVRISKAKRHFEKGYMANWTEELFTIVDAHRSDPPVYRLVDWHGDSLDGTSTNQNCRRSSCRRTRRIVSRRSCADVITDARCWWKWFGYPESFNSWIDARTLTVVYMNGDTPCCFFLLQSTRSVSDTIMIVVVLGAFALLIRWRKNLLVRRQIAECINDVFVQRRVRS